ncbi:hypothetical protein C2W62_07260 [Candidatus Entotheonella serta]|nr:hypothetical protein C2W62_07260 [Candidatus Entotheonella serta]
MMNRIPFRRFLYPGIVLLVIVVAGGTLFIRRIQANAQHWAETGKAAITLLKKCQAGVAAFDQPDVMACYDDAYANDHEGIWSQ